MVSTNRKALVRAYMHEHGVKYTEALHALGHVPDPDPPRQLQFMMLSGDQHEYDYPRAEGTAFATFDEAKAAVTEDGDVVTSGYVAPDSPGGPERWHSHPYGNWAMYTGGVWGDRTYWDETPQRWDGWTPAWFTRFPTPAAAAAAPGIVNGDVAYGNMIDGIRFVTASGSLVTRVLPYLNDEAAFSRFSGESDLVAEEMEKITASLDPRLGIRLGHAQTPYGTVTYWEFETRDVAQHISWSSIDRSTAEHMSALAEWAQDEHPHTGSINRLPFDPLETCEHCPSSVVTRQHPLGLGQMIGRWPEDFESVVDIALPASADKLPATWDELLLVHALGSTQLVSHDGCAEYWCE
ncbi:hypothetical protein QFZ53_002840 [Microbacterium natoriense]|uniref:Uncharacterized protein n=1 Tax=Microbacterium natoriense TaxID=284570 RepID=A0AAW8F184_9MICO|nr:hypothetical protein [Microbacterium natoriense]MDQ0648644.1 hypothetical protein [Microbacterium natoriense]